MPVQSVGATIGRPQFTTEVTMNGTIHRLRHRWWRRTGMETCPYNGGYNGGFMVIDGAAMDDRKGRPYKGNGQPPHPQ